MLAIQCLGIITSGQAIAASSDVDIVGDTQVISSTAKIVGNTSGDAIQTARAGKDFHIVVIGLPSDETVQLELGFAELQESGPGQRIFDLTVNDKPALTNFDIVEAAGGPRRSIIKKFTITPQRGFLDFHFSGVKGDAAVNYIQLTGEDLKKLISAPSPVNIATIYGEGEYTVAADEQASFDVDTGTVNLDSTVETWNSGLPVGGIGTGKFEILPNGQFANFTINNSWDLPVLRPRGTFLAVAAKASSSGGTARILQVNPSDVSDKKDMFEDYPTISQGTFRGEFPFGKWNLTDEKLPLEVQIDAWSPLIPYNVPASSLPGAVISVTLKNPKSYPVSTAVAFSWEDLNGRGGSLLPNDQHGYTGQSTHQDAATSEVTGIQINSGYAGTGRASTFTGNYFVGTPIEGAVVTRNLSWNPRTGTIPWWKRFRDRLRLDKIPNSPSTVTGKEKAGPMASTVCVSFNLAPKETRRIPFIVSWYFPKIVTLDSVAGTPSQEVPDYADRFGSSIGVASYLSQNRTEFRESTAEWFDMVTRSNVPQWMKTHALNSLFPMHSNTILLKNDRFAMLEAPAEMKGMLGAVDLRLSADNFLLSMFPALEKTELNLYARAQDASGRIPRYVGNIHGALAGFDPELLGNDWADPTAAWLLQVGAYWRETADEPFIASLNPVITKARDFLTVQVKDNLVRSTTNVFSATDFFQTASEMSQLKALSALRIAQELLHEAPEETDQLIAEHFNESDLTETTSTFAALLAGEYGARRAGVRGIVSNATITDYLDRIYNNNYTHTTPVPLMEATAEGNAPGGVFSFPAPLQAYVGALGMSVGLNDPGIEPYLRMFQIAYAAQKAPWKQALRYDVPAAARASVRYHRSAMAAWSVWRGLSGVIHDVPNQRLYINPHSVVPMGTDMEIPVFTPSFWGWMKYNSAASTGTLAITRINTETTPTLTSVASGLAPDGTANDLVSFTEPFALEPGAKVEFTSWPRQPDGTVSPVLPPLPEPVEIETTGSLTANDAGTTDSAEKATPLSSPETAEGEEMPESADEENAEPAENSTDDDDVADEVEDNGNGTSDRANDDDSDDADAEENSDGES